MASESIAHSAFGLMGYWLGAHSGSRNNWCTSPGRSVVCDPSGRSDVCCYARLVLSEHWAWNRCMPAENTSGRDPLSPAEEENLLSQENESANDFFAPGHRQSACWRIVGHDSNELHHAVHGKNAMKRLADAPEDHATPPKRSRNPPAASVMSNSGDSDPENSDSEELNFPPNGDPPKLGTSVTVFFFKWLRTKSDLSQVLSINKS